MWRCEGVSVVGGGGVDRGLHRVKVKLRQPVKIQWGKS